MAGINDITQASYYRGDPALGGGFSPGITIDPTPIQKLSEFRFQRDAALYRQKQIDDANAAEEISRMTAYDITSPLNQYSDYLKGTLDEIKSFISQNPNATVYGRDPEGFQKLKALQQKFNNARAKATASDVIYNARKAAIDKEPDLKIKALKQAELDLSVSELFSGGVDAALNRTLSSAPEIKADDYEVPAVPLSTYETIGVGSNQNYLTTVSFVNIDDLMAKSKVAAMGLDIEPIDVNRQSFKSLSPERQKTELARAQIKISRFQSIKATSQQFQELLDLHSQQNPGFDYETVTGSNSGDTLMDMVGAVNDYNRQIDQLNVLILGGKLKDPTGKVITKPFEKINYKNGMSPYEIILLQSLQKSKTPLYSIKKSVQETDNSIQNANIEMQREGNQLQYKVGMARVNADANAGGGGRQELIDARSAWDRLPTPSNEKPFKVDVSSLDGEGQYTIKAALERAGKYLSDKDVIEFVPYPVKMQDGNIVYVNKEVRVYGRVKDGETESLVLKMPIKKITFDEISNTEYNKRRRAGIQKKEE